MSLNSVLQVESQPKSRGANIDEQIDPHTVRERYSGF